MKNSKFLKLMVLVVAGAFAVSCEDSALDDLQTDTVVSHTAPETNDDPNGNSTLDGEYKRTNE